MFCAFAKLQCKIEMAWIYSALFQNESNGSLDSVLMSFKELHTLILFDGSTVSLAANTNPCPIMHTRASISCSCLNFFELSTILLKPKKQIKYWFDIFAYEGNDLWHTWYNINRRPREIGLTWLLDWVCTNSMVLNFVLFTSHFTKQPNLARTSLYALIIRVSRDLRINPFSIRHLSILKHV